MGRIGRRQRAYALVGHLRPTAGNPPQRFGGAIPLDTIFLNGGHEACISLSWDSWPVTTEDFDLFVIDERTGELMAVSDDDQSSGLLPPVEQACFTAPFSTLDHYGVAVVRYSAAGSPQLDLTVDTDLDPGLEHRDVEGSVVEPASSPRAIAAGEDCSLVAQFATDSSQVPTVDGRVKPDLIAPDRASWAGTCGVQGFSGTSFSAAVVAGAAAKLLQRYPGLDPGELQGTLEGNALARSSAGAPDNRFGYGSVWQVVPSGIESRIFFESGRQLFSMRPNGSDVAQIVPDGPDAANVVAAPNVSRDGTKIVYTSPSGGVLYVVNADGSGLLASPPGGAFGAPKMVARRIAHRAPLRDRRDVAERRQPGVRSEPPSSSAPPTRPGRPTTRASCTPTARATASTSGSATRRPGTRTRSRA